MNVGSRVQIAGRHGMIAMDNEDSTWNVEFDDGGEDDVATALIEISIDQSLDHLHRPEEAVGGRTMPTGISVVADPASEPKPEGWTRFVCFSDTCVRRMMCLSGL